MINELINIPPSEFINGYVPILNNLYAVGKGIHVFWDTPYDTYIYDVRYRIAKYLFRATCNKDEALMNRTGRDWESNMYFAIANWLDWKGEYDLHTKYQSNVDLKHNTGLVLKHPMPVLSAAAVFDNNFFVNVIGQVPEDILNRIHGKAELLVNDRYRDRYSAEERTIAMERAKERLLELAEQWEPA